MSGRTAAALCLAAFFAAADAPIVGAPWEWMTAAWSSLTAAVEEGASDPGEEPGDGDEEGTGGDEGWLVDPNG